MFQKYAPLIILIMFALGTYFMLKGMDNALDIGKRKPRATTTIEAK